MSYKLFSIGWECCYPEKKLTEPLILTISYDGCLGYSEIIDVSANIAKEVSKYDKLYYDEIRQLNKHITEIHNTLKNNKISEQNDDSVL